MKKNAKEENKTEQRIIQNKKLPVPRKKGMRELAFWVSSYASSKYLIYTVDAV